MHWHRESVQSAKGYLKHDQKNWKSMSFKTVTSRNRKTIS